MIFITREVAAMDLVSFLGFALSQQSIINIHTFEDAELQGDGLPVRRLTYVFAVRQCMGILRSDHQYLEQSQVSKRGHRCRYAVVTNNSSSSCSIEENANRQGSLQ